MAVEQRELSTMRCTSPVMEGWAGEVVEGGRGLRGQGARRDMGFAL